MKFVAALLVCLGVATVVAQPAKPAAQPAGPSAGGGAQAVSAAGTTPPTLPWGGSPSVAHGPSSSTAGIPEAHAWVVREMPQLGPNPGSRWQAYHAPPRRAVQKADGKAHGSPDGGLRPSASLVARPEAIAAWGEKAWFIFEPVTLDPKQPSLGAAREVLAVSARQRIADLWVDEPLDRLLSEPSLPGRGRLAGFVGTPTGPAALVDSATDGGPQRWSLRVLLDGRWAEVNLPEQAPGMRALTLVPTVEGVSVVGIGKSVLEWWRGTLDPMPEVQPAKEGGPEAARPAPHISWARSTRPLTEPLTADEACGALFTTARGALFAVAPSRADRTWSTVRILECDARGPQPVAEVSGARGKLGLLPMDGLGRLGLVWDLSGPEAGGGGGGGAEAFVMTEVSLLTGAELFSGPWRMMGPLTRSDVLLVLVALSLVTASILVFVLRTDATPEVRLPEGLALADPFRRFVATGLDLSLAAVVASRALDIPLADFVSPDSAASGSALHVLFMTMGVGFVMSTVGEVFFGRTIGKALTGSVVIQVPRAGEAALRTVRPGPAVVRNLIKWGMSPVVALTFLEPSGRHRAEVLTGTAVVVPVEPEGDEGSDGGEP